jgi:hypothetical protein
MIAIRRGSFGRWKASSEVIQSLLGRRARPPVATRMFAAVIVRPATSSVCGSMIVARPSMTSAPALPSRPAYASDSRLISLSLAAISVAQSCVASGMLQP